MKIFRFYFIVIFLFCLIGCHSNSKKTTSTESVQSEKEKESSEGIFFRKISGKSTELVPGKSVGDIHIGDKPEKVVERLGKPDKGEAGMCKSLNCWFYGEKTSKKTLSIFSECDPNDDMRPHIQWIRTTDPTFKTKNRLGVGSIFEKIKSVYSQLEILGTYSDSLKNEPIVLWNATKAGIMFEIGKQSKICRAVTINEPGKPLYIAYFSFYPGLILKKEAANENSSPASD